MEIQTDSRLDEKISAASKELIEVADEVQLLGAEDFAAKYGITDRFFKSTRATMLTDDQWDDIICGDKGSVQVLGAFDLLQKGLLTREEELKLGQLLMLGRIASGIMGELAAKETPSNREQADHQRVVLEQVGSDDWELDKEDGEGVGEEIDKPARSTKGNILEDPDLTEVVVKLRSYSPGVRNEIQILANRASWRLVLSNLRFVRSMANKYANRGVPVEDLLAEGILGLWEATERFDYRRGNTFLTYAGSVVQQSIYDAIGDQGYSIRLARGTHGWVNKLNREKAQLEQELGREPTLAELSVQIGLPPGSIAKLLMVGAQPISLDQPAVRDEEGSDKIVEFIGGVIAMEEEANSEQAVYDDEIVALRVDINVALKGLKPQEKKVLEARFGFRDGVDHSLEETAALLGMNREQVRQIEIIALRRLRISE